MSFARTLPVRLGLAAACAAVVFVLAARRARAATPDTLGGTAATATHLAEKSLRIGTPRGPIRIYRPALSRSPIEVIVYVHGYYSPLDATWSGHDLVKQFKASGRPAVFIAVEAPVGPRDTVRFADLGAVLARVQEHTGWKLPQRVVAVGHSGAYRTLLRWLGERRLRHLVLLDTLYAGAYRFARWFNASRKRRLTVVVKGTMRWTRVLEKRIRSRRAIRWCPWVPTLERGFTPRCRSARAAFVRSQLSHGALAYGGRTIPVVLRDRLLPRLPRR